MFAFAAGARRELNGHAISRRSRVPSDCAATLLVGPTQPGSGVPPRMLSCVRRLRCWIMTRAVVWPAGKKSPHGSGIVTVTTPAQMLRDALQELGWTQKDLAAVLQRPMQTVNEIAQGKKRITATTAYELEAATGIWARDWLEADLENEMRRAARKPIGGIVSRAVKMRKRKEAQ